VSLKLDQIQEGIAALEAALQANPNNADAAYTLATAYVGVGEIEKAEALLEGPLRSNNSAEVHLVRGSILNASRNGRAAIQELTKAKQLNEELPTLQTQLGYAYLLLAEHEQAIAKFLVALAQNPDDFQANAYLGWLYIKEKQYPEATERLTAALRQKPDNSGILYQLGQIQYASGQIENAAALLERVVKQQPDFVPAHVLLARIYIKLTIVNLETPKDLDAAPGASVKLSVKGSTDPDGDKLSYSWWQYREPGAYKGEVSIRDADRAVASVQIPTDAKVGDTIHLIAEVTDAGKPPLTRYARVIVTVRGN
jgi:tetratricopeptide (TPR) repeat protein